MQHRLSGAVNGVFHPWEPAVRGPLPRHGLPLCSSKGKSRAGARSSLQPCPGCSSLPPACLGCLGEMLVPVSARSCWLVSLRAHFWVPSNHIFELPSRHRQRRPWGRAAQGPRQVQRRAGCAGLPVVTRGLRGSISNEAELSAEMYGLAATGEAGATRTTELHVLRHLLPKPLRAPASLTALAPVQSLFKSPVQPPKAQILSPVDKLIDSSSDLIIFCACILVSRGMRRGSFLLFFSFHSINYLLPACVVRGLLLMLFVC